MRKWFGIIVGAILSLCLAFFVVCALGILNVFETFGVCLLSLSFGALFGGSIINFGVLVVVFLLYIREITK